MHKYIYKWLATFRSVDANALCEPFRHVAVVGSDTLSRCSIEFRPDNWDTGCYYRWVSTDNTCPSYNHRREFTARNCAAFKSAASLPGVTWRLGNQLKWIQQCSNLFIKIVIITIVIVKQNNNSQQSVNIQKKNNINGHWRQAHRHFVAVGHLFFLITIKNVARRI